MATLADIRSLEFRRMHNRYRGRSLRYTCGSDHRDTGGPEHESLMRIAASPFGPAARSGADVPLRGTDIARPPPEFSGPECDR